MDGSGIDDEPEIKKAAETNGDPVTAHDNGIKHIRCEYNTRKACDFIATDKCISCSKCICLKHCGYYMRHTYCPECTSQIKIYLNKEQDQCICIII